MTEVSGGAAESNDSAIDSAGKVTYASKKGVWGWIFYDWAAQPFFTIVLTFIFGPYFVGEMTSSPVEAQSWWVGTIGVAGLLIAIGSPFLGAISDAGGPRKPWIAAFSIFYVVGCMAIWFAVPNDNAAFWIALGGFVVATIGAEFGIVFTNGMMSSLVPEEKIGRLSGTGWAMGYVGGLIALIVILGFVIPKAPDNLTMLGFPSIFGLDAASFEGERFSGPMTAVWYLIFVIPLFLFTPDAPKVMTFKQARTAGIAQLKTTFSTWRENVNAFKFLVISMFYRDALLGVFTLGGVIGVQVFGWPITTVGVYGILLSVTGAIGAFLGGKIDDKSGPKKVVIAGIIILFFGTLATLSIGKSYIFFYIPVAPGVGPGGLFASTAETTFVIVGAIVGLAVGPLQAASRSMLIRIVPTEKLTEFFGLYALTGKSTSFVVPFAILGATVLSNDFRIGLTPILVAFAIGLIGMFFVKEQRV